MGKDELLKEFMSKSPEWRHGFIKLAKVYKNASEDQRRQALKYLEEQKSAKD